MLSKSQAKAFFLIGTAACSLAFIGLTLDTFKQIPKQTHVENMTESVIRGKHLWEVNNCMGCHTLLGEGAYYAPELTKVFTRRGETYIKAMLKDPQAMFPTGRQMTNFHFKDEEINDLVAFLKWIGETDLNGFPAKPDLTAPSAGTTTTAQAVTAQIARPTLFNQVCTACHSLGGSGGNVGPALDGIGSRRDSDYLSRWLRDPQSIKPDSKMPKMPLSDSDIAEITSFLSQMKEIK